MVKRPLVLAESVQVLGTPQKPVWTMLGIRELRKDDKMGGKSQSKASDNTKPVSSPIKSTSKSSPRQLYGGAAKVTSKSGSESRMGHDDA